MKVYKAAIFGALILGGSGISSAAEINMAGSRLILSDTGYGKPLLQGRDWDGRTDFGYGGNGGNLEAYSKDAYQEERRGSFFFVYGGAPASVIRFTHHNGAGVYTKKAQIDSLGNLYVANTVNASSVEVKVQDPNSWPDYVFKENYTLMPLDELSAFIKDNKHLPGVVTQEDVARDGVDLGKMSATLLKKVEELTLYVIDLKEQNDQLRKHLDAIR